MRLNANEYLGCNPQKRALMARCWVYLNDRRVSDCIIADEEGGYIVQHVRNAKGALDIGEDGEVKTQRLEGKVRILDPLADAAS